MLSRIVKMSFLQSSTDAGLLFLRVSVGLSLFMKHGYEKIFNFSQMAPVFSDPLHLGSTPSLIIAMISDSICSLLIVFGLGTRWAAAWSFATIFVGWAFQHHFLFFGHLVADHGELSVLYIVAMGAIFIAGPGRFSVDALLKESNPPTQHLVTEREA
jgi:putative oxidoreductase